MDMCRPTFDPEPPGPAPRAPREDLSLVGSWLGRSLAARYAMVVEDELPSDFLELLPAE
jgi:hypothetical protein